MTKGRNLTEKQKKEIAIIVSGYILQGMTIREIESITGIARTTAHRVVQNSALYKDVSEQLRINQKEGRRRGGLNFQRRKREGVYNEKR